MESKLTYYDIVAHLVPGSLVVAVLVFIPRVLDFAMPWPSSDIAGLALGVPVAYAVGQVVQGLASTMQPLYYWLWGGRPSSLILKGQSKLIDEQRLSRVVTALGAHFGAPTDTAKDRESLFSDAMALCNTEAIGRVDAFNASYAFHRALLTAGSISTLVLAGTLCAVLTNVASSGNSYQGALTYLFLLSFALTAVEFIRARQRGGYFAAEVLNAAYIRTIQGARQ